MSDGRETKIIGGSQEITLTEEIIRIFDKEAATLGYISCSITMANKTGSKTTTSSLQVQLPKRKAGLRPIFGSIQSLSQTGFAIQITNYDPSFTWLGNIVPAIAPSIRDSTEGASISINGTGLITISGLSAGTTLRACANATKRWHENGADCFTGSSLKLMAGLTPVFGSIQSQSQTGFAIQITNYDPSWTWLGSIVSALAPSLSSLQGASISINGTGLMTISGLPEGYRVRVYATNSRTGYETSGNNTSEIEAVRTR
jgi:hypothetical protein